MPGKSAIEVEQPPSAKADANRATIDHCLIVRSNGIRPEVPNTSPVALNRLHRARWYEPCNAKSSGCVNFTATVQTIVARND
jgi:hypothetical protein